MCDCLLFVRKEQQNMLGILLSNPRNIRNYNWKLGLGKAGELVTSGVKCKGCQKFSNQGQYFNTMFKK